MAILNGRKPATITSLLCGAALGAFGAPAWAQSGGATSGDVSEVVVTGSRVPRPNLDSVTPVVTVTAAKIEASSSQEVGALLRDLPSSGVSFSTPQTSAALVTTDFGLSSFNLRNLGENRTLVLVDSRRFVSGSASGNIVDFNSIPPEMIERIDVVTGGASAIYGSDALAGVVNVITRKDFKGLVISGQGGIGEYHDGENYRLSATGGDVFGDGKGHAIVSLSWSKDNGAFARNRPFLATDSIALAALGTGAPGDITSILSPFLSSYSEKGRFNLTDGSRLVVDDDGVVKPFSTTRDGFNRQAYRGLSAPLERYGFATNIDYEVAPAAKWFAQVNYSSVKAQVGAEPFPLDSYNIYGGNNPANQPQCAPGPSGVDQCQYGIPLTSALIPAALKAAERALEPGVPDQDLVVGFSRRLTEIGSRDGEALRQTFRFVTGFTGDLPGNFKYDTSLDYGRTTSHQDSSGQVNVIAFRNALDAIVGPGGQLECADPSARAEGCVPVDIFGRGNISPAAAKYVAAGNSRDDEIQEVVLNGFIEGPAIKLPAGDLHLVLGGEYREEKLDDVPDALTQTGLNASNITPPTHGAFHVKEAFVEVQAPLLKDMRFAQSLDLDLSARISDYSSVGRTNAYAANLDWRPVDGLRFRAQAAHAVRAPNLFELFSPGSQTFPSVNDPCQGVTRASNGAAAFLRDPTDLSSGVDPTTIGNTVATHCIADPNIAKRVANTGGLVLSQAELQSTSGFISGNPNLRAETSNSYSAGVVIHPVWVSWLAPASLSLDYYNISVNGGVGIFGQQITVDQCYQTASPVFCSQIVRNGPGSFQGSLGFVNQQSLNLASIKTEGVDLQFNYVMALQDLAGLDQVKGDLGKLGVDIVYTHLINLTSVPFPGGPPTDSTGVLGAPRNRATIDLTYTRGRLRLFWDTNIVGKVTVDNGFDARIGAQAFHNVQGKYDITDHVTFIAGVDNLFNKYVFIGGTSGEISSSLVATTVGQRTEPTSYDALGRRYYAAFRLKF